MNLIYDSAAWRAVRDEMLTEHLKDDFAVRFVKALFTIAETWDDLADGDKAVPVEAVHTAFKTALLGLPSNPFFTTYAPQLLPLMTTGINAWLDATMLESGDETDRTVAYVLRDWYCEIAAFCVFLLHGDAAMRAFSAPFRRFHMSHEPIHQYLGGAQ